MREVHNYVRVPEYGLERVNTLPVSLWLIRAYGKTFVAKDILAAIAESDVSNPN